MSLYLKYRPRRIEELDLTSVRSTLAKVIEANRLSHAYLLTGPRGAGKTICPSEVARQEFPETWREEMEAVRQAARRLVAQGLLEITQQGHVVDASTAKGAIRLRLTPQGRQKK